MKWLHPLRTLCALMALLVVLPLHAQTPATQPAASHAIFWKIKSPTTEVYFVGSIHAGSKDMYPLPPEIDAAYAKSKVLMVEVDIDKIDKTALTALVMQKGLYADGDSLDKHLSAESMKAVRALAKEYEIPDATLNQLKPVMVSVMLSMAMLKSAGMDPDLGIDKHFLDLAHKEGSEKKVVELETADEQLNLLFGLDDKVAEVAMLDELKDDGKTKLTNIFDAWKSGDVAALEKETFPDPNDENSKKLVQTIIYDRNDRMTKKIAELLKGNEPVFVVVGAAHLIGDKGILKQLEKQNFKVEWQEITRPPAAK